MRLEGTTVRLRAVEPEDTELLYAWENDPRIWAVSGTTEPFSRAQLARFVEAQLNGGDLLRTGQLRLIIEARGEDRPVGIVDLFEYDPLHRRAGVGILIHAASDRRQGYAHEAIALLCDYAREVLQLHQLWCDAECSNTASLQLFRKAGFEQAGLKRDWQHTPAGYADVVLLQKILDA